jgi:exonuclease III
MNIQGLVWNCRRLRKRGTSTFLKDLIDQYQFHFIGLQETMVENCEDSLIRKFDPQQNYLWLWNPSKGKSGGILVGVKLELYEVGSFRQGEYMIQLNLWDKLAKIKWNLLIVYGAAHEEGKIPFLSELSSFCSSNQEPLLIGGDFNIIRYASEKSGNGGVHRDTNLFNSLINFYELKESNMSGGT